VTGHVEWIALGGLLVGLVALSLVKVGITDTPWHLSTARHAFAHGAWPTQNTFSYTHPDYPLYQQYPLYQALLYLTYVVGGWTGLSLLHCALWVVIIVLGMRWGGSWRCASLLSLAWLIALLGMQRRMALKPELLTIVFVGLLLLLFDAYRRRRWCALCFVLVQLLMVNSHQLFPLGLALQGGLLAHVILVRRFGGRWGISIRDQGLPLWPLVLALVGSVLACFANPLGLEIIRTVGQTAGSLLHHREQVQELAPFYSSPYVIFVAACAAVLAIAGFWLRRRDWQPFELLLWLLGAVLLMVAIRGIAFFALFSVGILARSLSATLGEPRAAASRAARGKLLGDFARVGGALLTLTACVSLVEVRWFSPPRVLGGIQPGAGMEQGVWPHHATSFLKQNPPPGRMLNLGWYSGNPLIMDLFPAHRVFVDPRFEAYPRPFLSKAIQAQDDISALRELVARYQPTWLVAELRLEGVRRSAAQLIGEGSWAPVFLDPVVLILVRDRPEAAGYLAEHRLDLATFSPPGLLRSDPQLLAQQQLQLAGLYRELGLDERADQLLQLARSEARNYPTVQRALELHLQTYP
jgi:hypothetical protein